MRISLKEDEGWTIAIALRNSSYCLLLELKDVQIVVLSGHVLKQNEVERYACRLHGMRRNFALWNKLSPRLPDHPLKPEFTRDIEAWLEETLCIGDKLNLPEVVIEGWLSSD